MRFTVNLPSNIEHVVNSATDTGQASTQRVSMLMAFGLNASHEADAATFHLPGFIQYIDAPKNLSLVEAAQIKEEFRIWVVASGFRDLHQGMESFLNALYHIILIAECKLGKIHKSKVDGTLKQFERKGLSRKFEFVYKKYGFDTAFSEYFNSLAQARNCLTHRNGIVGNEDLKGESSFKVNWLGLDAEIVEHDGTIHPISSDTLGPFNSDEFHQGGKAKLTTIFTTRTLSFGSGERIEIPPRSLQEICSMTSYTCLKFRQLTLNWLIDKGADINSGVHLSEPAAELVMEVTEH